ncbi:hypothetical protein CN238_35190, partial [Sinorhizobium meliloti]
MQGAAFSLRLVVIVGFGVEIALIADLDLGDERKRDRRAPGLQPPTTTTSRSEPARLRGGRRGGGG